MVHFTVMRPSDVGILAEVRDDEEFQQGHSESGAVGNVSVAGNRLRSGCPSSSRPPWPPRPSASSAVGASSAMASTGSFGSHLPVSCIGKGYPQQRGGAGDVGGGVPTTMGTPQAALLARFQVLPPPGAVLPPPRPPPPRVRSVPREPSGPRAGSRGGLDVDVGGRKRDLEDELDRDLDAGSVTSKCFREEQLSCATTKSASCESQTAPRPQRMEKQEPVAIDVRPIFRFCPQCGLDLQAVASVVGWASSR